MLVSIIIPCYNSEKYLTNTVESVLSQSYKDIEVILINDGSKDDTWSIIQRLEQEDSRIKGFSKENKGVSAARNLGIDMANGEFISFLDSDDTYEKDKIKWQVDKMRETNSKVCYCGNKYVFPDTIVEHVYKKSGKILKEYILNILMIHLNDWMVETKLIKENNIRFQEAFKYGEDVNFFMKVLALSEAVAVEKQLTNYYIRETSSSFNNSIRNNDENNYIKDFEKFLWKSSKVIYDNKEINEIVHLLNNFLLPQVIIRNIVHCKNDYKDLSEFEKQSIKKFKFNVKNLKSSIKFYCLYLKVRIYRNKSMS